MTRRIQRLAEEMRQEVASVIGRLLKDPRVGFITITRVELAEDLRNAKVYFGTLGDDAARKRSLEGLKKASGFIRREIGQRIRMHHTPELSFHYDPGIEATDRVARLLDEVERRDSASRGAGTDGEDDDGEE